MILAENYKWLETITPLPKLVTGSLSYLGLKEYPGTNKNNPVIMNMAKELDVSDIYKNDEVSWCALFMCFMCKLTGKPMPFKSYEILRAASFKNWGDPVVKGQEQLGDVLVFTRPGGNHVGLYIAETEKTFIVLGGNQSNSVSFTEILKSRLTAARRHYATPPPESVKKYFVNSLGKVSSNEE